MGLPYLQSYNEPKLQKAYERSLAGESLRRIAKGVRFPLKTLARSCREDGWMAERKARAVAAESSPATVATEVASAVATAVATTSSESAASAADASSPEDGTVDHTGAPAGESESRVAGMTRMLARQQRIVSRLITAYERDVERTFADADATGRLPTRSQVAQLVSLGKNLLTMERKAWCVPDKIETKDTTLTPDERVRKLKDDELERELAAAEGAAVAAVAREASAQSVN